MSKKVTGIQQFIHAEIEKRKLGSLRRFAEFVGVGKSTLSRIMDVKDPATPSLEFLYALAQTTNTDIRTLVGLVHPDVTFEDAHTLMLAQFIGKLPRGEREVIERLILGAPALNDDTK